MWVTTFNQGTALLLILTRLLAEQARASDDTGGVVDGMNYNGTSSAVVRPAIFDASLAFMYVENKSSGQDWRRDEFLDKSWKI